jgi:hypothetical protein
MGNSRVVLSSKEMRTSYSRGSSRETHWKMEVQQDGQIRRGKKSRNYTVSFVVSFSFFCSAHVDWDRRWATFDCELRLHQQGLIRNYDFHLPNTVCTLWTGHSLLVINRASQMRKPCRLWMAPPMDSNWMSQTLQVHSALHASDENKSTMTTLTFIPVPRAVALVIRSSLISNNICKRRRRRNMHTRNGLLC